MFFELRNHVKYWWNMIFNLGEGSPDVVDGD